MANIRTQLSTTLNQFYHQPVARVSLELFLSLGAVMFFAVFAIRPTLLTMSDLVKEIEDKEKLDGQLGQKIAALYSAQSEYLSLESRLPLLNEAIPAAPQLINSLQIIEKLASDRQLVISSLTINSIPSETAITNLTTQTKRQVVSVTVTVIGDYPVIRAFVEDLRQLRRVIIIESIAFSNSDNIRGQERGLRAQIQLGLPYYGANQ